jgi:hypothetical protein
MTDEGQQTKSKMQTKGKIVMATLPKKAKKVKKAKKAKQPELPAMTGAGVEVLHFPDIEEAADAFADTKSEINALKETLETQSKNLIEAIDKHRSELPQEVGGGVSYRYGERLVTLKPTSERIKVKTIHDEAPDVTDENN